ncbi:MAG: radical SAM protein, partial [Anaerolineae bacterium]|nr:radical SAM protein [Anaerolineae bacterium]
MDDKPQQKINLGTSRIPELRMARFPNADDIVRKGLLEKKRSPDAVDILLVNPPTPDGELWIRSQHRVGRRTRENMIWPQVSLAQMAAILHPTYTVKVVDANAERMDWGTFTRLLDKYQPRYYMSQLTAPTLENDMYGVFLAKARGAVTIVFGTHATPIPVETMRPYPSLDFVLVGEPDLTIRDLLDHLAGNLDNRPPLIQKMIDEHDPSYKPSLNEDGSVNYAGIAGLCWRRESGEIVVNRPRPFIKNLDDLPIPMHELLPLQKYRMPWIKGPFTFIVSSRGCTAGCTYCIKHVSYQFTVRIRSPHKIMEELWALKKLGINNIHMYADLFTVSRDQVVELCKLIIEQGLKIKWTCNSRVDYVDVEMLMLMGKAGCWVI